MWISFQKIFKYAFSTVCIIFRLDFSQHSQPLLSPGVSRENLISQTLSRGEKESKHSVPDNFKMSIHSAFSLLQTIFVVTMFLPMLLKTYNRNFGLLEIFCLLHKLRDILNFIKFQLCPYTTASPSLSLSESTWIKFRL